MPWKKLWQEAVLSRFVTHDIQQKLDLSLVTLWLEGDLQLDKLFGDWRTGMVALESLLDDHPEVTSEYVTSRLRGVISEDTARRRLAKMHKEGVLTRRKSGRTIYYRLKPDIADAAILFIRGDAANPPGSAQPQIAGK